MAATIGAQIPARHAWRYQRPLLSRVGPNPLWHALRPDQSSCGGVFTDECVRLALGCTRFCRGSITTMRCPAICDDCGQCDIGCCTRGGAFSAAAVSSACRGTATFNVFGRGCPNPECSIPIPTRVFAPHAQGTRRMRVICKYGSVRGATGQRSSLPRHF